MLAEERVHGEADAPLGGVGHHHRALLPRRRRVAEEAVEGVDRDELAVVAEDGGAAAGVEARHRHLGGAVDLRDGEPEDLVADEVLGLPIAKVHGAAQVEMSRLDRSQGAPVLPYDGELVPVHDLDRLLGIAGAGRDERAIVVADGGDGRVGLAVDALLGQHEAVLKPLGAPLDAVAGLSAVTVLGNGRPVFILDVQRLLAA